MDDAELARARALSVPTRAEIHARLRRAAAPLGPQELAAMLGVHHTAVRQHVAVLAEAGLVTVETLPPSGRGRPRVVYRALDENQPYQELAAALALAVERGIGAREAGRERGRTVPLDAGGAVAALQREAERLGFQPRLVERRGGRVDLVLDACPFAGVAARSPAAVCALHHGLAEGIAERDPAIELVALHATDPHRGGCRLVLRRGAT